MSLGDLQDSWLEGWEPLSELAARVKDWAESRKQNSDSFLPELYDSTVAERNKLTIKNKHIFGSWTWFVCPSVQMVN